MACRWVYLASYSTPERLCGQPGDPLCEEHQKLMGYLKLLDDDFEEMEKTHKAVYDESLGEQ
jgi:hypothetical protein